MPSIAAVLIVKNEAESLPDCLMNLGWCDEIIVVDAGSDDETVNIARNFTEKIYVESDWQGFGIQRQRAQKRASADWILMIDADERVTDELQVEIKNVLAEDDRNSVYAVPRLSRVFGKYIRHSGWYPDYVVRLYPREKAGYGNHRVHEKLIFDNSMSVQKLHGDLLHFTYRDLDHYLVKSAQYANEWAKQRVERGKKTSITSGVLHGVACFIRMYILYAGFLDGRHGFLLAVLSAHSTFAKYADLWIRNQSK